MYRSSLAGITVACLLLAGSLSAPAIANAEQTEEVETDLQFSKHMTERVGHLQARIKQLQSSLDRSGGRTTNTYGQTPSGSIRGGISRGPSGGTPGRTGADQYERIKLKLNSLEKKAEAERKRLQAPQGSQSKSRTLDRKSIESKVRRIERDLEKLQREMYGGY